MVILDLSSPEMESSFGGLARRPEYFRRRRRFSVLEEEEVAVIVRAVESLLLSPPSSSLFSLPFSVSRSPRTRRRLSLPRLSTPSWFDGCPQS